MAQGSRAGGMRLLGVVVLLVGVIGGLLLWWFAGKRYDDAVEALAPAPIGCDTTLVFDRAGTYTLFIETKGRVGEIDGNCDADDRSYDLDGADVPDVDVTLLDDRGGELDLDPVDGPTYDRAGAAGEGFRSVEIDDSGDYVLSAEADATDVMIRVGRDPSNGVAAMRIGAVAVALVGLIGGVVLLILAQRPPRVSAGPAGPTERWPHVELRPPPTAPPYANPPVPPPYAAPPRQAPQVPPTPPTPARPPGGWPGRGDALPPPPPPGLPPR